MIQSLFIKSLILLNMLLFVSLPVIAFRGSESAQLQETPSVRLKEENFSSLAKFKGHEDEYLVDSTQIIATQVKITPTPNDNSDNTKKNDLITPAVQSVAVFKKVSPTPQLVIPANSPQSLNIEQITFLGTCEAGMDPTKNTGNGYYGAFQFSYGTWTSMNTGYERADLAPLEVQIDAVQRLLQRSSIYTQFPACARKMQSMGIL